MQGSPNAFIFAGPLLAPEVSSLVQTLVHVDQKSDLCRGFRDWQIEVFVPAEGPRVIVYIDSSNNLYRSVSEVAMRVLGLSIQESVTRQEVPLWPITFQQHRLARLVSQGVNICRVLSIERGRVRCSEHHGTLQVTVVFESGEFPLGSVRHCDAELGALVEEIERLAMFATVFTKTDIETECCICFPDREIVFSTRGCSDNDAVDSTKFQRFMEGKYHMRADTITGVGETHRCQAQTLITFLRMDHQPKRATVPVKAFGNGDQALQRSLTWQRGLHVKFNQSANAFEASKSAELRAEAIEVISRLMWFPGAQYSKREGERALAGSVQAVLTKLKNENTKVVDEVTANLLATSIFAILSAAEPMIQQEAAAIIGCEGNGEVVRVHICRLLTSNDDNDDDVQTILLDHAMENEEIEFD